MSASAFYAGDDRPACHIIPLNDWREHEASTACWCHPQQDEEVPDVWVHQPMDQRDRLERGEIYEQ